MYRILADNTLIYDSTLEDYKIGKGTISLEINKSGSFTFSIYPDHFYYDRFIKLKTVITVYRSDKIVFRGRILNDVTDHWNNKVITCEGELGFLQDSIIRPFTFNDTPENLFRKFIEEHNSQVDDFKKFKIGAITVTDPNNYIARSNSDYDTTLNNLTGRLTGSDLGGYFYITHDDNGTDPIPTLNYVADFTKVSSQVVEFGSNLKNYTKTVKAEDIATAIIPIGAELSTETNKTRLTIAKVNNGKDYVYDEEAVALYGWIFKVVTWDNVSEANNLKRKAEEYLQDAINQNVTVELNAIDLHLIDRTIESFNVCDNVRVISKPHNFDATLLCNRQTLYILRPENDSLVLGYAAKTLTREMSSSIQSVQTEVKTVRTEVEVSVGEIRTKVEDEIEEIETNFSQTINSIELSVSSKDGSTTLSLTRDGVEITAKTVQLSVNAANINGKLTANQIETKDLKVDAANITGKLSLDHVASISFEDLSDADDIRDELGGGLDETEVYTLITNELVSSPTIMGGKFMDSNGQVLLEMDANASQGTYGLIFRRSKKELFTIWEGDYTTALAVGGLSVMYTDIYAGVIYAEGTWDFSNATVYGI